VTDSAKYIATLKKNDEKTRMSAVDAELYLGYKAAYMGIGSVKKMIDPMRCEKMSTGFPVSSNDWYVTGLPLTSFVVNAEDASDRFLVGSRYGSARAHR
jgi:hypothetical protein